MKVKNILGDPFIKGLMVAEVKKRIPQPGIVDDKETEEKKKATLASLKEFFKDRNNRIDNRGTRDIPFTPERLRLTEENLGEFLSIVNMSYKEFFEIITKNLEDPTQPFILDWPSAIDREMCEICDSLPHAQKARLLALCKDMLPQNAIGADDERHYHLSFVKLIKDRESCAGDIRRFAKSINDTNLMWRLGSSISRYEANRAEGEDETGSRNLTSVCTIFSVDELPYIANKFGLPLHLLMNMDNKTTILAKHGDTEEIMDMFCLIDYAWPSPEQERHPQLNRKLFVLNAARGLAESQPTTKLKSR